MVQKLLFIFHYTFFWFSTFVSVFKTYIACPFCTLHLEGSIYDLSHILIDCLFLSNKTRSQKGAWVGLALLKFTLIQPPPQIQSVISFSKYQKRVRALHLEINLLLLLSGIKTIIIIIMIVFKFYIRIKCYLKKINYEVCL